MHPSHFSFLFLGFFTITILLLERWQETSYPWAVWLFIGLLGLLGLVGLLREQSRYGATAAIALILGIAIALLAVQRIATDPSQIPSLASGSYQELRGIVAEEPDIRGISAHYVLNVVGQRYLCPTTCRILVTDPDGLPRISYGDEILASGTAETPEGSYARYLQSKNIRSIMRRARTERIVGGHGSRIMMALLGVKGGFQRQLQRIFPEPEASLLSGLLLGTRNMPERLEESFRRSGLMHITAISGFNITLVLNALGWILFFLPARWRLVPSVVAIAAFTLLVGASASAVRAAIMGSLGLLALHLERPKEMRLLILWAFFVMAIGNPRLPWYDPGFQLSFLAVIGITEFAPAIKHRLPWVPDILETRGNLAATLAAQIFVLPILAAQFGTLSLVSPLANVLVAPAIPAAMLLGFLGITVSFFWFPLGQILSFLCFGYLLWIREAAELSAGMPFAEIAIEKPTLWLIGAYYGMLVLGIAFARAIPSPHPSPKGRGGMNGLWDKWISPFKGRVETCHGESVEP